MKAPDKLYIGLEDVGSRHRVYNVSVIPNGYDEYISKNALQEWAKEVLDSGPIKDSADKGDAWSIGYLCGMRDIIDKLNSL